MLGRKTNFKCRKLKFIVCFDLEMAKLRSFALLRLLSLLHHLDCFPIDFVGLAIDGLLRFITNFSCLCILASRGYTEFLMFTLQLVFYASVDAGAFPQCTRG
mgnify:CR=1 FL=1